jgi:hypothetical protein
MSQEYIVMSSTEIINEYIKIKDITMIIEEYLICDILNAYKIIHNSCNNLYHYINDTKKSIYLNNTFNNDINIYILTKKSFLIFNIDKTSEFFNEYKITFDTHKYYIYAHMLQQTIKLGHNSFMHKYKYNLYNIEKTLIKIPINKFYIILQKYNYDLYNIKLKTTFSQKPIKYYNRKTQSSVYFLKEGFLYNILNIFPETLNIETRVHRDNQFITIYNDLHACYKLCMNINIFNFDNM